MTVATAGALAGSPHFSPRPVERTPPATRFAPVGHRSAPQSRGFSAYAALPARGERVTDQTRTPWAAACLPTSTHRR
ncbi:hypothetical protein [Flexivirga sp. B27]